MSPTASFFLFFFPQKRYTKIMNKQAELTYEIIRSGRRTLGMEVKNGRLIVRAPYLVPRAAIARFVESNRAWAEKALKKAAEAQTAEKLTEAELKALTARAKAYIPERVRCYAPLVGVTVNKVTIRCQKTKWGSCSAKGNLNFNCLLMLMPPEVIDSVVVHELCHRRHMDHSAAFYADVRRVFPEYDARQRYLKEHGPAIMARVF